MVTKYNIYRDGEKLVSEHSDTSFTDTGLTPNTLYEYQVSSVNSVGDESKLSNTVSVTTEYSDVESVALNETTLTLTEGDIVDLEASVEPDTAKQDVKWSSDDESIATVDSNGKVTTISNGEVTITAESENGSKNATCIITVEILDETAPKITLNGENPLEIEIGENYEEPGATAEDDVDGDITNNIEISGEVDTDKPGEYEIIYTVSDEAGNSTEETRVVNVVDKTAPEITLIGDNPLELEVGDTYDEQGASAEDNVDGDITDDIEISGEVNTEEVGEYEITYTVSDAAGNETIETRIVNVTESEEEKEPDDGDGEGSED